MLARDLGGIQQAFVDYSTALKKQGHEVINITSFFARINKSSGGSVKLPNLGNWCIVSRLYLRLLITFYKPDLLIAHGGRAIDFAISFKPSGIPLVGVAHNYQAKRLKKCDYIISITNILIKHLTSIGFDPQKLFLIPNMHEVKTVYLPKPFRKPLVIGSFGRFVAKKGFNFLLEAVSLLKLKGYNVKLMLGGGGTEEKILRKLVRDLNLDQEVTFTGWVQNKQAFFEQIDIFCLPSVSEPFGIILLEAMEYSTPIVATKSGGPTEILQHEENALLTEIASASDLADKIAILVDQPATAQKMAFFAYLHLTKNYDIDVVGKNLSDILLKMKTNK